MMELKDTKGNGPNGAADKTTTSELRGTISNEGKAHLTVAKAAMRRWKAKELLPMINVIDNAGVFTTAPLNERNDGKKVCRKLMMPMPANGKCVPKLAVTGSMQVNDGSAGAWPRDRLDGPYGGQFPVRQPGCSLWSNGWSRGGQDGPCGGLLPGGQPGCPGRLSPPHHNDGAKVMRAFAQCLRMEYCFTHRQVGHGM